MATSAQGVTSHGDELCRLVNFSDHDSMLVKTHLQRLVPMVTTLSVLESFGTGNDLSSRFDYEGSIVTLEDGADAHEMEDDAHVRKPTEALEEEAYSSDSESVEFG